MIDKYERYIAGYVGKEGGEVVFATDNPEQALAWTKGNRKDGKVAVCKGVTFDDLCCEEQQEGYIAEHLVENVAGFDGRWTKGFLYQLEQNEQNRL